MMPYNGKEVVNYYSGKKWVWLNGNLLTESDYQKKILRLRNLDKKLKINKKCRNCKFFVNKNLINTYKCKKLKFNDEYLIDSKACNKFKRSGKIKRLSFNKN